MTLVLRCRWLAVGALAVVAGCADPAQQAAQPPLPVSPANVTVDVAHPGAPVNPLILGNNVQWVDRGDELLRSDGAFDPQMLEKVMALGPTMLRYPGGSLSDTYHWQAGVGAVAARGDTEVFFTRARQKTLMGTRELLELCAQTGAAPVFTVNTATGDAAEAARWVAYVNGPSIKAEAGGRTLPQVRYWEIGNEPYLKEDKRKDLWIAPEQFARRAGEFIRAMKQADPRIVVGIPLRSDRLGGVPATPWPGYNDNMRAVPPIFDFVALHDAYLPFAYDKRYPDRELYLASMAAYRVVEDDFDATRALVRRLWPGHPVKLAVTEYNSVYTLGRGESDRYIATLAGALYVADLLRVFAQTPDVLFANFWSLSGNGAFGAVSNRGVRRPAYHVLAAYRAALRGKIVPVSIAGPTFDNPRVGYVPAHTGLPLVTGIAFLDGKTLRVLLVNKHPESAVPIRLALNGARAGAVAYQAITGNNLFDTRDVEDKIEMRSGRVDAQGSTMAFEAPAHSFTVLEIALTGS